MRFIDIYECIIKYYPLGLNGLEPIYYEYSGFKLLQENCFEKFSPKKHETWKTFLMKLKSSFIAPIIIYDQTGNTDPSYSCSLILSKNKLGHITYQKEICLHISVLGLFYTVYGKDTIILHNVPQYHGMETEPILYVSPLGSYEDFIPLIRSIIENVYSGFKYVPFYFLKKRVKALSIAGINTIEDNGTSVFQALFTSEDVGKYKLVGDINYE